MDRLIVLGSANAIPKIDQDNTHLYAESGEKRVLVDCGNNTLVRLRKQGIDPDLITDLVITHFHPDHAGSLPNFLMGMWLEKRTQPLTIHGLEFTLDRVKALMGLFGWSNWANMYPVNFNTVQDGAQSILIQPNSLAVHAVTVQHLIPTIGLRFNFADGKSATYSCDTEPCDQLLKQAEKADVLLQESAGPGKGHTSAKQAGVIAKTADVKKLILIHYDRNLGTENLIREARSEFAGEVVAAYDGLVVF